MLLVALVAGVVLVAGGQLSTGGVVLAGVVGWYVLACWVHPFRPCWRCHGSGKRYNDRGTAYGVCRWCKGLRIERLGRRAWTYVRHGPRS